MARTATNHTIIIESAQLDDAVRLEGIAAATIVPGEVLEIASGQLQPHSTAGGVLPAKLVALPTLTPDTITYPTTAKIDIPYSASDIVYYMQAQPGDVLNLRLAAGEQTTAGVTQLQSDGNGELAAVTVDATTLADSIVGVAENTVDNSGGGSPVRVQVRIT